MNALASALWVWTLAVLVHEVGHWAAARLFGITVLRVFLFSDVRHLALCRVRIGGTVFGIGVLPVMGYTVLDGFEPSPLGLVRPGMYHLAPRWKRALIIAAGPLMNALLAVGFLLMSGTLSPQVVEIGAALNGFLLLSALIPLPGTDGNHILRLYRGGSFQSL